MLANLLEAMKKISFLKSRRFIVTLLSIVAVCALGFVLLLVLPDGSDTYSYYATRCNPERRAAASKRLLGVASSLGYTPENFWAEYEVGAGDSGCSRVFVYAISDSQSAFEDQINRLQPVPRKVANVGSYQFHKTNVEMAVASKMRSGDNHLMNGTNFECATWYTDTSDRPTLADLCPTKNTRWTNGDSSFDITSDIVIVEMNY